jgi:hypothetical protein
VTPRTLYAVAQPRTSHVHYLAAVDWYAVNRETLCGRPAPKHEGWRRQKRTTSRAPCNACHAEACKPGTTIDW